MIQRRKRREAAQFATQRRPHRWDMLDISAPLTAGPVCTRGVSAAWHAQFTAAQASEQM